MSKQNKPIKKFSIRNLSSTIFEKKGAKKQGKDVTRTSICLQKSLRNPDTGEWENQQMFLFPQEIHALIITMQKAYEYCSLKEQL